MKRNVHFFKFKALTEVQTELIQMYTDVTKSVDVLPFKDESEGLPISNIFAPLLIEEDLKAKQRIPNPQSSGDKELKSLREIFYAGDRPAKRIFMKGEAGCGKTLFCLKMLDTWCQIKQSGTVTDDDLQQCLAGFDLVFYLPLRHYNSNLTSVKDMIGQTVSSQCLNVLVSGGRVNCLVILDGLDESPVSFRELPSSHGLVRYVLFCTSRPWKLTQLKLTYSQNDKVVQILGLLPSSKDQVIKYVLVNFYQLKTETPEYRLTFKRYSSMLSKSSLESLVKIPMMLTACCCMWYEEDVYSNQSMDREPPVTITSLTGHTSMTHIYLSLADSMIRRADEKCDLRSFLTQACPSPPTNIPEGLASFSYIHSFLYVLIPLCRLAYTDLMSDKTKLVFQKDELERKIGRPLVEIALKVGLISQTKAPGRFHQQNVSVNFYHKSVQEFLAAIHLTCTDTDDIRSYCTSLDKVMDVANIITFIIGLEPSSCSGVSRHVMGTVNTDADIQQYRRTFDHKYHERVKQLYLAQCQWYRELTHSRTVTGDTSPPPSLHDGEIVLYSRTATDDTSPPPNLHVTDIWLVGTSDIDTIKLTEELIARYPNSVISVYLFNVDYPVQRALPFLPLCTQLSVLSIAYLDQFTANLVAVIPCLTQLDTIRYNGLGLSTVEEDVAVVAAILKLTQLRYIKLVDVRLGQEGMALTVEWTQLQTVALHDVRMSAGSWVRFKSSIPNVQHPVMVIIKYAKYKEQK